MGESSSKPSKTRSNGEGKKRAKIQLPIAIISSNIQIKLRRQNLGGIVLLAGSGEELIGEDGEFASVEGVELPVTNRDDYINEHHKPSSHIEDREPRGHEWASMVSRDASPIEGEGTEPEPTLARPDLLGRDAVRPNPTHPREERQDLEQVTWKSVVDEARSHGD